MCRRRGGAALNRSTSPLRGERVTIEQSEREWTDSFVAECKRVEERVEREMGELYERWGERISRSIPLAV